MTSQKLSWVKQYQRLAEKWAERSTELKQRSIAHSWTHSLVTWGASTFVLSESLIGSPSSVFSLTFVIGQSRAYSMIPAWLPSAVTFNHFTLLIHFSGRPTAEKICRAPVISTFSIVMLRNSQSPRSGGITGVFSTIQWRGMFFMSLGMVA